MIFVESLYDAVIDCLKVMPVLFLAYLLVSFLSHDHSHKFSRFLSKNKKTSVFYASFLGCVPQCGFSSVIADLYSKKNVSLGTLIAVFIATSDEALPIMLTNTDRIVDLLILIGVKIVLALIWGYVIDLVISLISSRKKTSNIRHVINRNVNYKEQKSEKDSNSGSLTSKNHDSHNHECGHIHTDSCDSACGHSHGNCCGDNIFLDACMHTTNILLYIFVATLIINLIVGYCGDEFMRNMLTTNVYAQIFIASLIGLIPNCASSVVLVELFMCQTLPFPALIAGLTSGAGVGLLILFSKNKKHPLQNLGILALQYSIGVISGLLLTLFI